MKRVFSFLLVLTLSFMMAACGDNAAPRTLVQGESAAAKYSDFIAGLGSGKIVKYEYSFDSWYDMLSTARTAISFSKGEEELPVVSVSRRHPAVFWDSPAPKYFDGSELYYKYKGEWYTDRGGFKSGLGEDFFGFPRDIIDNCTIKADNVYTRPDGGYDLFIQTEDDGSGIIYVVTCQADSDYNINNILISTYTPTDFRKTDYRIKSCYISYSDVNKDKAVLPPKDLAGKILQ